MSQSKSWLVKKIHGNWPEVTEKNTEASRDMCTGQDEIHVPAG
jgi:hypothetical protein